MRGYRYVVGLAIVVGLTVGAAAAPHEREPQGGTFRKVVRKIKALGDLLTIPVPAPKP
jgi:hypothetical protein